MTASISFRCWVSCCLADESPSWPSHGWAGPVYRYEYLLGLAMCVFSSFVLQLNAERHSVAVHVMQSAFRLALLRHKLTLTITRLCYLSRLDALCLNAEPLYRDLQGRRARNDAHLEGSYNAYWTSAILCLSWSQAFWCGVHPLVAACSRPAHATLEPN